MCSKYGILGPFIAATARPTGAPAAAEGIQVVCKFLI